MSVPAERPPAPQSLLALHNKLDEVRAHPPPRLKTWAFVSLAILTGAGATLFEAIRSGQEVGFGGLVAGLFVAIPATLAARLYISWRGEIRRLEQGIERFEER